MGKKKKDSKNLGRALIKDRFSGRRTGDTSLLHTADIADGFDWGRLNLQSVTEENSFQEFLSTAELAGTEFQAEKLNIAFVNTVSQVGLLSDAEKKRIQDIQETNKQFLQIPRRPKWDADTTPEELHSQERDAFLNWRRKLAQFQEANVDTGLILTPFEKNIEFWRQLWRVVEKSDIVVQIVDARNPLLFRCEDLEKYVEEVSSQQDRGKTNFILVNKADFLTEKQRDLWVAFFDKQKVHMAFFSAIKSDQEDAVAEVAEGEDDNSTNSEDSDSDESEAGVVEKDPETNTSTSRCDSEENEKTSNSNVEYEKESTQLEKISVGNVKQEEVAQFSEIIPEEAEKKGTGTSKADCHQCIEKVEEVRNSSKVLNRKELINLFKNLKVCSCANPPEKRVRTVGLVGYPNVGKSSTINCLMEEKKVSVSATPGKTKHFQTLFVDSELMLCDCPGLVMPSFVSTQAEMVLWGILPVDRLRDHVPSVSLLATLIPRAALEDQYGIMLPRPAEGEDPDRPPSSEELLNAYGYIRGFMTQRGLPDNPRTSRYVLKDFINGKLLYCKAPPGQIQKEFHEFNSYKKKNKGLHGKSGTSNVTPQLKIVRGKVVAEELDKAFFKQATIGVHSKGIKPIGIGGSFPGSASESAPNPAKPWKKHNNKNKREKLRRVYSHLDQ